MGVIVDVLPATPGWRVVSGVSVVPVRAWLVGEEGGAVTLTPAADDGRGVLVGLSGAGAVLVGPGEAEDDPGVSRDRGSASASRDGVRVDRGL